MQTHSLLVELLVEELPPKALKALGEAFAQSVSDSLRASGLASATSAASAYATPRRLALHLSQVAAQAADKTVAQKLMPVAVGLDSQGQATPALLKKLHALGADASAVPTLQRKSDGKTESLVFESLVPGVGLALGLQKALDDAIARLPIPKVMSYQLESGCELPGWTSVSFVRPAHGLVALHGEAVVPVQVLGLQAGRETQGHRFEASNAPLRIADADSYANTLRTEGAVIASFAERRSSIVQQLAAAAAQLGQGTQPIEDEALLDEVTALVERPNVLLCSFEPEFLAVPQECLILTMKANQKYFPLVDAQGQLSHRFLVVSNISPDDPSAIIAGNERVVRPRLADAKFFFDQDRKRSLESRVAGLDKVVYHNKLGTQGERSVRVHRIAASLAQTLGDPALEHRVALAARLAKTDLLTDMVGEFPELQGIMGAYYARHDGLDDEVARAIEDHYKPRFAGDTLPRDRTGLLLALADKLETLVGMFGIGNLPTGDKDPFALRRHALGVLRILTERDLPLDLDAVLNEALPAFAGRVQDARPQLLDFLHERFAGLLREQGFAVHEVDAVLSLRPQRLNDVPKRLHAVRAFAALPQSAALAAANKRIGNILKKSDTAPAQARADLLQEAAERALHAAMTQVLPQAAHLLQAGDYTASLQALAALREPVDAFFADVMVNAEDPALRQNRLGLLHSLHQAMNQIADLARLAA